MKNKNVFSRAGSSIPKNRTTYLDNAASTPIDPKVKQEMIRVMDMYGNPSSFNDAGRTARKLLEESRLKIARFIGAKPEEIIFTSSGSEANNLAILGIIRAIPKLQIPNNKKQIPNKSQISNSKPHIIVTKIEHPSVLEPIRQLEKIGFDITYLSVDREGFVNPDELIKYVRPTTVLVSIMYANNEIGTIQDIKKISKIIKNLKPVFHVDACQATEYLEMNVNNLGVDLMTFNGTKIYGPRGIGVLYKKGGVNLSPLVFGGNQEHGLRAGTENLSAIAGLAKAVSLIKPEEGNRVLKLRDYFLSEIKKIIPGIRINGPEGKNRLSNNVNISIPGLDSENLLLELDKYGIYASSGSACTARSVEPSHVLRAIGVESNYLNGALRFSLGRQTKKKDIERVLKVLPEIVSNLKKRYKI